MTEKWTISWVYERLAKVVDLFPLEYSQILSHVSALNDDRDRSLSG